MEKIYCELISGECNIWKSKFLRKMRIVALLLLISITQTFALESYAQTKQLSLNFRNETILNILDKIEDQSEFYFMYDATIVDVNQRKSISCENQPITMILDQLLKDTKIVYEISDRQIVLTSAQKAEVGQSKTISGKVTDSSGAPLPGVSVVLKGTTQGTITDADGNYSVPNIPGDATLVFSFVGMKTQEIYVGGKMTINVIMTEEAVGVGEVVVTALGIEKNKRNLTYATQQVNMEDLTTIKDVNLGNALAGKVAGLTVTSSSGAQGVGGDARITIRGSRSINNNNQPLVVVDGIPVSDNSGAYYQSEKILNEGGAIPVGYGLNTLSVVNPDDVESINVLKGPSASAVYGSSAQNGVIVITTKKGKRGRSNISINSVTNFDLPYLYPEYQNEYGQGYNGQYSPTSNIFSWGPKMTGQAVTDWTGKQVTLDPQPDNVKDFFKTGYNLINTVSYSTGVDKSTAYFSYGNTTSRGLEETNKMQRHNFNLRLTSELLKNLKADFKLTYTRQKIDDALDYGTDGFNVMNQFAIMPRSIRNSDIKDYYYIDQTTGEKKPNVWSPNDLSVNNPYWAMYANETPSTVSKVNAFVSLRYDFTSWLYLQLRTGLNTTYEDSEEKTWWGTPGVYSGHGDYRTAFNKSKTVDTDALLVFNKQITKDFRVGVNIGSEVKDVYGRSILAVCNGLSAENKFALAFAENPSTTDRETRIQKQAVYGMANLNFKEYLLVDLTARTDWSSTLPSPYNYFYPSVGLTNIVSDMVKLPYPFSFLKLRGSYAEVGNDAQWAVIFQDYVANAFGPVGMLYPNPTKVAEELIPEKTKSWEAGAEIGLFEDRLNFDFTWYKSNTYNQLILVQVPPTSGYSLAWINCGNIQNTGVELLISGTPVKTPSLTWNIDLNFSRNRNKVIALNETTTEYSLSSGNLSIGDVRAIVGRPYGEVYTKGFLRNDAGKIIVDSQGAPKVDNAYNLYLGNYNYDWQSGLTNTFSYKNWILSCLLDLNYGGVRQSVTESEMLRAGTSKQSLEGRDGFIVDGVKEDGTPNDIVISAQDYAQKVGGRITSGSGEPFNHDATNARLREFSVGYNVPVNSKLVKSLRVSLVGRNLFFIYNGCKWFDPDVAYDIRVNGYGTESFSLPVTRTLGVNIKLAL